MIASIAPSRKPTHPSRRTTRATSEGPQPPHGEGPRHSGRRLRGPHVAAGTDKARDEEGQGHDSGELGLEDVEHVHPSPGRDDEDHQPHHQAACQAEHGNRQVWMFRVVPRHRRAPRLRSASSSRMRMASSTVMMPTRRPWCRPPAEPADPPPGSAAPPPPGGQLSRQPLSRRRPARPAWPAQDHPGRSCPAATLIVDHGQGDHRLGRSTASSHPGEGIGDILVGLQVDDLGRHDSPAEFSGCPEVAVSSARAEKPARSCLQPWPASRRRGGRGRRDPCPRPAHARSRRAALEQLLLVERIEQLKDFEGAILGEQTEKDRHVGHGQTADSSAISRGSASTSHWLRR